MDNAWLKLIAESLEELEQFMKNIDTWMTMFKDDILDGAVIIGDSIEHETLLWCIQVMMPGYTVGELTF